MRITRIMIRVMGITSFASDALCRGGEGVKILHQLSKQIHKYFPDILYRNGYIVAFLIIIA